MTDSSPAQHARSRRGVGDSSERPGGPRTPEEISGPSGAAGQRYRAIFEQAAIGIATLDPESGAWLEVNASLCRMLGYTREELLGRTWTDITHPDDIQAGVVRRAALKSGQLESYTLEKRYLHKDGHSVWARVMVSLLNGSERPYELSVVQDIDERKRAETALRMANERLRLVQEAARIGHWDWDIRSGELLWSERCKELFGVPPNETMSYQRFLSTIVPEDREDVDAAVRRAINDHDGYEIDMRVRLPDGAEREIVSRGRAYFDTQGQPVRMSGMAFDVSEQRLAQRALVEGERRLRQMLESLPQLVWTCNANGEADYLSPQWLRYTGSSLEENLSHGWERFIHPADRERLLDAWQASTRFGEPLDSEARILGADGKYRWFKKRAVPLRRDDGSTAQWFGVSTEITALVESRNEFERRVLERTEQLEEANAELQSFAHSVAHDLRAPLRNIHGYATAILEDEAPHLSEDGALYARRLIESASRLDELIQDLLAYSRLSRAQITPERVELDIAVARSLGSMTEEIAAKRASIDVEPHLPAVLGHRSTIHQVLTNLISNSLKFVQTEVSPRIRISATCDEAGVRLTIADNGIGIDPRHQEQVFGVFERLHSAERYPGTGIGLAIVRKGMERMGGSVQLESALGQGSRFILVLQRAPEARQ